MNQSINQIKDSLLAGQPIVQIVSFEEKRIEGFLKKLCQQTLKSLNIYTWESHNGLSRNDSMIPDSKEPAAALDLALAANEAAFFVFKDLNSRLRHSPGLIRKIRECYLHFKNNKKFLFLLSPDDYLPTTLKKEIDIIHFELPDYEELENLCAKFLESMEKAGIQVQLSGEEKRNFVTAVQGLTLDEAYKAYMKSFQGQKRIHIGLIEKIHLEKKQLILKENVLEFLSPALTLADMGGLDKLKDWLMKRKKAFSKEAREFGLDKPKGILTMGVTGCGKSLASKIIATLWNLPLFRMDMNLVYSGIAGAPEEVFARSLKTMDSVAPAVLWIDEIESGISDKQTDGSSSRILGYFLTWMQEHTSEIFIAATANRIDLLPAELLRRGRFDQIFFIDLPTRKEREEIFTIHLTKRDNDLSQYNIPQLAQITKNWSGSEIEQVIISGMYEAFAENRKLNEDDLFVIFGNSVPLATTMEEQIKKVRSWAHNRAVRASTDKEY
ncbi:MAG: AAA family ATPase [Chrysiogenales bacterium]|nr:MAG: AAA family ATPase [Chrysiogenales bacterium]